MQKRKKAAFSIILLMTMLLVSAIQPLAVHAQIEEEVYAGGYFYTTNWFTSDVEADNVSQAFSDISNLMANQVYWIWENWELIDTRYVYNTLVDYSDNTNSVTVTDHIPDCSQGGLFAADLYVGHLNHIYATFNQSTKEDFSTGDFRNWDGIEGNVSVQSEELVAGTSESGSAQIGRYLRGDKDSVVEVMAKITFDSLNVPQGSDSRLELLEINAGDDGGWEYSVAASINNPNGVPVWTVEIYEGGTPYRFWGLQSQTPEVDQTYQIRLLRDISNGQAELYVSKWNNSTNKFEEKRLVAAGNHLMTKGIDGNQWIGVGIVYQSESGTNQVTIDDILTKPGNNTYGFKGTTDYPWANPPADGANPTMDYQIYDVAEGGTNEKFVFLWVCDSAYVEGCEFDDSARGMAYCWSNGAIHNDGYNEGHLHPDGSGYAFIGFEGASPFLSSEMGTTGTYGIPNIFKYFLVFFYCFALCGFDNFSVNEALDLAASYTQYPNFESAPFAYWNNGFWLEWPYNNGPGPGSYQSLMRVYGDGSIYLPQTWVIDYGWG